MYDLYLLSVDLVLVLQSKCYHGRIWSSLVYQSLHLSNTGPEEARKISFVLQGDQDNESIGSSKNSLCGGVSCYFYILV